MKKKVIAGILAAAMIASLSGCGAKKESDGSASGGSSSSKPLQVVIWDNNQKPGLMQITDEFTKETGIKVDIQVKDWDSYWTLLEAGASGGDMPDIFWMHSNNSQLYMKNDMLLKLDDYIAKSDKIKLENYMPEITELYTYEGAHYAIPKDYDTIGLWYNKTLFDEANIPYPDETWTWDKLLEVALQLTDKEKGVYGFAMNPSNDQDTYYNMIYANNGYVVSEDHKSSGFDNENTLEAMDYVAKLLSACPDAGTMSETGTDVMFNSGTVAMITQGSWMINGFLGNEYAKENADISILPYNSKTGIRATMVNGLGWAASAGTDRPDDCWKLLEWFGSKEMQEKQAQLGVTMSAYMGTSDKWENFTDVFHVNGYLDITKPSTIEGVENKLILRPYTYNSSVWGSGSHAALAKAWEDPSKMREVCTAFAKQMNDDIAKENK